MSSLNGKISKVSVFELDDNNNIKELKVWICDTSDIQHGIHNINKKIDNHWYIIMIDPKHSDKDAKKMMSDYVKNIRLRSIGVIPQSLSTLDKMIRGKDYYLTPYMKFTLMFDTDFKFFGTREDVDDYLRGDY